MLYLRVSRSHVQRFLFFSQTTWVTKCASLNHLKNSRAQDHLLKPFIGMTGKSFRIIAVCFLGIMCCFGKLQKHYLWFLFLFLFFHLFSIQLLTLICLIRMVVLKIRRFCFSSVVIFFPIFEFVLCVCTRFILGVNKSVLVLSFGEGWLHYTMGIS